MKVISLRTTLHYLIYSNPCRGHKPQTVPKPQTQAVDTQALIPLWLRSREDPDFQQHSLLLGRV